MNQVALKSDQEVIFELMGHGDQMLRVDLKPGQSCIADSGSMCFMDEGIDWELQVADGSEKGSSGMGKWFSGFKRMISGSSFFTSHFKNRHQIRQSVGFAAPHIGSIVAIHLGDEGGSVICQKGSFLAAGHGVSVDMHLNTKIKSGLFGGENLIFQKIQGEGMAFISSGGTVVKRHLDNETLRVESGCLVAYSEGIEFDIKFTGGLKTMLLGQEGVFVSTLKGRGSVWIQSLPFQKMADRIVRHSQEFQKLAKQKSK